MAISSRQKAKIRPGTITFRLPFIEWDFQEAGVSTEAKRSGGRVQMQEIRKMSRSRIVDGDETKAGSFVRNTSFDG